MGTDAQFYPRGRPVNRLLASVLALLICAAPALADATDAVVRIPSHGASGTVIYTAKGKTLILSCAHMLEGGAVKKPIAIDAPSPTPGAPRDVGVKLLAYDFEADLSLIEVSDGPLPYVCPVAPEGHRIRSKTLTSAGYDEMKLPATVKPATYLGTDSRTTWTREIPWHGRSGGALIDGDVLVGVVQGYTTDAQRRPLEGMYVSHGQIVAFLRRHAAGRLPGVKEEREGRPSPIPISDPFQVPRGTPVRPYGPQPACPDGLCPKLTPGGR